MMSNRSAFSVEVLRQFQFLVDDFGFQLTENREGSAVKYTSNRVVVSIYLDYGYELDLFVALISNPQQRISLRDVAAAYGKEVESLVQASTPDRIHKYVDLCAHLLQEYGADLLRGDQDAFRRLLRSRRVAAENSAAELQERQIRRQIDAAWRDHR